MNAQRSEALLLRAVDFGESDRVLHLLIPDGGRLTAIAKGARRSVKRFGGTLDFFNHLQVQFVRRPNGAMARLDQATLIRPFVRLRSDPRRFALGCYLLELLDRLAPERGARSDTLRLFAFAVQALELLEEQPVDERFRLLLELRALDSLGLRPELQRCVRCAGALGRNGADPVFHVPDGGPLCPACAGVEGGAYRVAQGTLRTLEQGLRLPLDRLPRLAMGPRLVADAGELLRRFRRFHTGLELRSEAVLREILVGAASADNAKPA